ncbi:MAG: hypothetical protein NTV08_15750 [Verrucomicrobia bacterium]|nr:hypothetical protein [Verrucomicrobiota bacterium]
MTQRRANIDRLRGVLSQPPHCIPDAGRTRAAQRLAHQMPLSHATAFGNLEGMLRNGSLLSQLQLGRRHGSAEAALETMDDVFLYAAAFSYPDTECGFLFLRTIEADHQNDGVATPFDSGAFVFKIPPPAPYPDGVAFVRSHELPVSDYREILGTVITHYSPTPEDYLARPGDFSCACGVSLDHPFQISGGDHRVSTFEVRIPQRIALQPPHLRAVFVQEGFEIPELSTLFASGVSIEKYRPSDDGDYFHALRESCINFIQEQLIP